MNYARFASVTLVGAAGIKPRQSMIHDPMMESWTDYARQSFRDDASFIDHFGRRPTQDLIELWDYSREMTARVTWKPWMWSRVVARPVPVGGQPLPVPVRQSMGAALSATASADAVSITVWPSSWRRGCSLELDVMRRFAHVAVDRIVVGAQECGGTDLADVRDFIRRVQDEIVVKL